MKYVDIARPYAKAAFEFAKSKDAVPTWSDVLANMRTLLEDPAVVQLIATPRLPLVKLADMLLELSKGLDAHQQNFIRLVVENGRVNAVPAIVHLFEEARSTSMGEVQAELVTAQAADSEEMAQMTKALSTKLGKTVTLNNTIDGSIIGGAIIKTQDWVIDGSLKAKLEAMSKELMKQG